MEDRYVPYGSGIPANTLRISVSWSMVVFIGLPTTLVNDIQSLQKVIITI